jgi:hypothetical protein
MLKKTILIFTICLLGLAQAQAAFDLGSLATASATEYVDVRGMENFTFVYTISGLVTNIVLRPEMSIDGTTWVPMDTTRTDTTITSPNLSSDNAYMDTASSRAAKYVRVRRVSSSGGTPNVSIKLEMN